MTIKFFIDSKKRSGLQYKIIGRVTINRRKSEFVTDFSIAEDDWDPDARRPKKNVTISRGLSKLENRIYDIRQAIIDDENDPTAKDIVNLLTGRASRRSRTEVIDYYEKYVQEIRQKKELSNSNIKHNAGTCKILKNYLELTKRPYLQIKQIDHKFLHDFDNYLMIDYRSPLNQKIVRNTVNHHHRRLKALLNRAIKDGIIKILPYANFQLKNTKTERTYLTDKELKAIRDLDLENNPSLIRARDIFLFACNTGVRWSDSQELTFGSIEKYEGNKFLRFYMRKTQDPVAIPLTKEAASIIKKYKIKGKTIKTDKILPQISGQKFNNYIKHIATLAGVQKTVTHHVARHTFATIGLMNGIPIDVVQKLLGHSKLETTRIYAKTLPKTLFAEMEKFRL